MVCIDNNMFYIIIIIIIIIIILCAIWKKKAQKDVCEAEKLCYQRRWRKWF